MLHRETEVKIRIASLSSFRNRLKELGFVVIHKRSLENNILFDMPDRALRKVRSILRLRRYGSQSRVTYKGPPDPDQHYKSRLEAESEVGSPETFRAIFQLLGLVPVFCYQKYRTQFALRATKGHRKPSLEIALDETPIGNFIELEGSRAAIDGVARQLGYSRSDYTTASYGALYLEECRKKNIPPSDMVFDRSSGRSRRKGK
jgi:adenylate cyclase class 2